MLREAFVHYRNNFSTAMAFAILLVFILPFSLIANINIESGTSALDYSLLVDNPTNMVIAVAVALLFILFYSVFTSLIIFAVRKDMVKIKIHYYLTQKIEKFSLKIFVFYTALFLVLFVINALLIQLGAPALAGTAISFLITILLLFVPQSIVIDELSLRSAIHSNFDFMKKNPAVIVYVLLAGITILAVINVIEYALDYLFFIGRFITPVIVLVFAVPYIECIKSIAYMKKYELVKAKQA